MKKLSFTAFAFILVLISACTSRADRTLVAMETLLDSLELQFAPDLRVELWILELSKTGKTLTLEGEVASGVAYDAISSSLVEHFPKT